MPFKATVEIGRKELDVLKCDYEFRRDVDSKGKPSSGVYGGTINLSVESTDDTSIVESLVNQYKPIDGTITFKKSDENAKMKEVSWEKGYFIHLRKGIDITATNVCKLASLFLHKPLRWVMHNIRMIGLRSSSNKNYCPARMPHMRGLNFLYANISFEGESNNEYAALLILI